MDGRTVYHSSSFPTRGNTGIPNTRFRRREYRWYVLSTRVTESKQRRGQGMEDRKNIEKTKRRGVERALVRLLGWPKKYDSWIDVSEIQ